VRAVLGFTIAADNGGDKAAQGGTEIAGGELVAGKEVGQVFAEFLCGAGAGFFWAWYGQKRGWLAKRGVQQRRPSEKVNEHKDARSFGLREDIEVSLELSFGIA